MSKVVSPRRIGEPSGDPAELVLDAIGGSERKRVVDYLSGGEGVIAGGYVTDPVTDDPSHRIPYTLKTDGIWLWSGAWVWFVERYGAALPADFLEHMRALGYKPPQVSAERAREIGVAEGVIPSPALYAEIQARQAEIDAAAWAEYEARRDEEGSTRSD